MSATTTTTTGIEGDAFPEWLTSGMLLPAIGDAGGLGMSPSIAIGCCLHWFGPLLWQKAGSDHVSV